MKILNWPQKYRGSHGDDQGAQFVEVGAVTMLAATIIASVLQSDIEQTFNDTVREMVCLVEGPECNGKTWVEADRPKKPEKYDFGTFSNTGGDNEKNKALGKKMAAERGWTGRQWECLEKLWHNESNWDHTAVNPSSQAWGIPQALPGNKMASAGSDWRTNPATQIKWGLGYIDDRYGSPCAAWAFWQNPTNSPPGSSVHWY